MNLSVKTKRGGVVSIHFGKAEVTTNLWDNYGWYVITETTVINQLKTIAHYAKHNDKAAETFQISELLKAYPTPVVIGHPYVRKIKSTIPVVSAPEVITEDTTNFEEAPVDEGPGAPPIDAQKLETKKSVARRIIKFFSEFTFTPAIRFVNTLSLTKSYSAACEYVNNYMSLCDHPDKCAIADKMASDEFKNICSDLFKCASGEVVNKRLEIYFGPAGTGKTTEAIAKYPNAKITVCNETMDSCDLMKTFSFNDADGHPVFKPSSLQEDMVNGRPHILDEINLLNLSALRFLQGILDGKKEIEFEGNIIKIADGFKIIGTMNLVVNGQVFNLPEPIVDRAELLKSYDIDEDILATRAF